MIKNNPVLFLVSDRKHYFANIIDALQYPHVFEAEWTADRVHKYDPCLVVSIGEAHHEIYNCLIEAKKLRVPTLVVNDGVTEWRDVWENPRYGMGGLPLNRQLFVADKIACHGEQQVRLFETWGMIGKTELVGMPWLNTFSKEGLGRSVDAGQNLVLICTANRLGFTSAQVAVAERSLADLKDFFSNQSYWTPIWRVRGGVDKRLHLVNSVPFTEGLSLKEVLGWVDAVISMPSTVVIESMLSNKPTAIIDYSNNPNYIDSAWKIHCREMISGVLDDLRNPSRVKLLHQDYILNYMVNLNEPRERMLRLINGMIRCWETARISGCNLQLPFRILSSRQVSDISPSNYYELSKIFPNHPVFGKGALDAAIHLSMLLRENAELREKLSRASVSSLLARLLIKMYSFVKRRFKRG